MRRLYDFSSAFGFVNAFVLVFVFVSVLTFGGVITNETDNVYLIATTVEIHELLSLKCFLNNRRIVDINHQRFLGSTEV